MHYMQPVYIMYSISVKIFVATIMHTCYVVGPLKKGYCVMM
jgi:hypothetical protein